MLLTKGVMRTAIAFIGIPLFLMVDSPIGDRLLGGHGQSVAVILVMLAYIMAFRRRNRRIREIMLMGVIVGLGGEFILSKVLGMYHYRLDNIPMWLAFGHGLLFALVFRLTHEAWVREHRETLSRVLFSFAIIYSLFWLYVADDWFGFLSTVAFLVILSIARKSQLFFLIMFAVVCYLEQIGTATGCWYWPDTLFGLDGWLPSGNPPVGIAVFYFIFDAIVLWGYLNILHPRLKIRYKRRYRFPIDKQAQT